MFAADDRLISNTSALDVGTGRMAIYWKLADNSGTADTTTGDLLVVGPTDNVHYVDFAPLVYPDRPADPEKIRLVEMVDDFLKAAEEELGTLEERRAMQAWFSWAMIARPPEPWVPIDAVPVPWQPRYARREFARYSRYAARA